MNERSHWESARSLEIHLGGDPCDPTTYRERYDAQLCVECGARPWARDCVACAEHFRPYLNCGEHGCGSRLPSHHGVRCHECWDASRLKQPEGFEVPDYWPIEMYGHSDGRGGLDRTRPLCKSVTRRCTYHQRTLLVDELCVRCVEEDAEDEEELPE